MLGHFGGGGGGDGDGGGVGSGGGGGGDGGGDDSGGGDVGGGDAGEGRNNANSFHYVGFVELLSEKRENSRRFMIIFLVLYMSHQDSRHIFRPIKAYLHI